METGFRAATTPSSLRRGRLNSLTFVPGLRASSRADSNPGESPPAARLRACVAPAISLQLQQSPINSRHAMTDTATKAAATWEDNLIADLRAHDGRASQGPMKGQSLLVMYTTGAKTGERRRAIVTPSRDGDDYVIAGTASDRRSTRAGWPTSGPTRRRRSKRTARRSKPPPPASSREPSGTGSGISTSPSSRGSPTTRSRSRPVSSRW